MYQITCDSYPLYDYRDDTYQVLSPKCKLEANTVCEASFVIFNTHPYYNKLLKLRSIFEIQQDGFPIFRGRMTNDSRDFNNCLAVDLEGVLAFTNDTMIPPFNYPEDFTEAASAANTVEYFLQWILNCHNEHAAEWQKLKLGTVTVNDPNNYITRSSTKYASTWDTLKSKLSDSELGGYLYVRYEADGNYVDYVSEFALTNTQPIILGENLLDFNAASDASETYSAILPTGATVENEDGTKSTLTLASLPDGDLTDDLVKMGVYIYSRSALEQYGWKCVPEKDSTWNDVTEAANLQTKAMNQLSGTNMKLSSTMTFKALDLHFTDAQIQSFKPFRNVQVNTPMHGVENVYYPLPKLEIDLFAPQNTTITIGDTTRTLVDVNAQQGDNIQNRVEIVETDIEDIRENVDYVAEQMIIQSTQVMNDCRQIILAALESYVETSNYEEFKETVEAQFKVMADRIAMNFTTTTEQITNVNGDLQAIVDSMSKHFEFSVDGLVIKAGENAMNLLLDNDLIRFMKNGQQFGWWDGVDFHTGNIVVNVNERAQFGNFAFVPRSNGSMDFLKVN